MEERVREERRLESEERVQNKKSANEGKKRRKKKVRGGMRSGVGRERSEGGTAVSNQQKC